MNVIPVILAGGQGSRFWPLSREKHPKQFLSISPTGETLIQATARRARTAFPSSKLVVITNLAHRDLVKSNLPDATLVVEPIAKNTAAAIGLAAITLSLEDPEAIMLILPSDHNIQNLDNLVDSWKIAADLAEAEDKLVTLGINPEYPHTGYGYIKSGLPIRENSFELDRFYEKPSLERAIQYCESGQYCWNAGMFVWKVSVILNEIKVHMPDLYSALEKIKLELESTKDEFQILGRITKEFNTLESISIDFGILEHSKNCAVVKANDIGWSDVGSWDVWADHFPKDKAFNTIQGNGFLSETSNCMIKSDKFFAAIGVDNLIVVDTEDGLLICHKDKTQDVKKVVEYLKKIGKKELL